MNILYFSCIIFIYKLTKMTKLKHVNPNEHESWSRGRAAYREKCEKLLVPIMQKFDTDINTVKLAVLPWATSSPVKHNPNAAASVVAMTKFTKPGESGSYVKNIHALVLDADGQVLQYNNSEKHVDFQQFYADNAEQIWGIMTRLF